MRYTQLRAFHNVALQGGFSRAAAALNQSQPSLSEQVRRLEQDHDVLLFHREGRRIRLTEAGEELLLLTKRFFECEEGISEYLRQSRAAVHGTLRIVADSALHVSGILRAFRARHPDVFVQISSGNSGQVLSALRNYDAEIGILGSFESAPDLEAVTLGASPIVGIAARGLLPRGTKSLSLEDLADHPLVFRETGSHTRQMVEQAARRAGLRLRPAIEVEGREAMREIVATGGGIGFTSEAEMGHDPRIERFALAGVTLEMTETLVYLTMRRDLRVIRGFLKMIPGG
ncbi:aminoethylphosphonate catabolism associated LysR family transcriptional regulator [Cribrihabitans marinus]|uniref:Aminoethylphosphonate catabolism associated LysR family transcriptional regulator n=1 Tax=Cribrihabitans marinus TaxID=1227549 RepID=A0A1H7D0P9_9RHOB|nr:LysR substrate-binding domain-containing protein [Cribrihabitans marinus]GGH37173.1 LysR family transcriptional regulator [Cribrihabitans marinus]SEJ94984.1 aminoethylphosphonate catabolism associated LysR family transcriptional regulator [Cribrihabitans marinus]